MLDVLFWGLKVSPCILNILYGGLGISKLQFLIKKRRKKFLALWIKIHNTAWYSLGFLLSVFFSYVYFILLPCLYVMSPCILYIIVQFLIIERRISFSCPRHLYVNCPRSLNKTAETYYFEYFRMPVSMRARFIRTGSTCIKLIPISFFGKFVQLLMFYLCTFLNELDPA